MNKTTLKDDNNDDSDNWLDEGTSLKSAALNFNPIAVKTQWSGAMTIQQVLSVPPKIMAVRYLQLTLAPIGHDERPDI